jgi:integrase
VGSTTRAGLTSLSVCDSTELCGPLCLVAEWIGSIVLDPRLLGTHSLRRTKATLIFRRTGNLRAVQLLLGYTKIESTVRYLGIEVDDALSIAEQVDV